MDESCARCKNKCMKCKLKMIRRLEAEARAASDRGWQEEATSLMLEALRLETELNLPLLGIVLRNSLGIIYARQGRRCAALSCCAEAMIPHEALAFGFPASVGFEMREAV